jgi:hypothetical protein
MNVASKLKVAGSKATSSAKFLSNYHSFSAYCKESG